MSLRGGMPGISSEKTSRNSRTIGMSWRDGSVASISTTLHRNPSHPHPSSLWAFIAVISLTPLFETFPLWAIVSLFGPLRVILYFGQFIWAWYFANQSIPKMRSKSIGPNLYKSTKNTCSYIWMGQSSYSSSHFTVFPPGRATDSRGGLDIGTSPSHMLLP